MTMELSELKKECEGCRQCELYKTRTNLVFGVGNEHAKIMFVGEAPGQNEDLKGEPFVGRAGMLLDTLLVAAGMSRGDVYIANILKCRPPQNRDPQPEESQKCIAWLRKQYAAIRPEIIVCLGRIAAQQLIDPGFAITKQHGTVYEKAGVKIVATFHPAALLRNPNLKPLAFADIKLAKQLAEE